MVDSRRAEADLGTVLTPSGRLILLDGGFVFAWRHDGPPHLPDWHENAPQSRDAVDVELRGRDATKAGRVYDRSNHPRFLFDLPKAYLEKARAAFEEFARSRAFEVEWTSLNHRLSHRERVDLALEEGARHGIVEFNGMWALVFAGLPPGVPLRVTAEWMPEGPDAERWRRVVVHCRDTKVARSERVGNVLVDEARLLLSDVDALAGWKNDEPLDGKADFIFWGRDAAAVAREVSADRFVRADEGEKFGWRYLPHDEALARARRVADLKTAGRLFAMDFRPHSHPWILLEQVRSTPLERGTLDLAGAKLCLFMTKWGDGAFPVEVDLDREGEIVRIRIELGDDAIVKRQREMEKLWFGDWSLRACVSARIWRDEQPIRFLVREAPLNDEDSGWQFYAGDEDDAFADDPENIRLIPLRELIFRDPTIKTVLDTAARCAFERHAADQPFRPTEPLDGES